MTRSKHFVIAAALLLLGGCVYHTRERVDQSLPPLICHPYDQQPPAPPASPAATPPAPPAPPAGPAKSAANDWASARRLPPTTPTTDPAANALASDGASAPPGPATDVQTVAWLEPAPLPNQPPTGETHLDLKIPPEIPGSEARRLELPKDPVGKAA
jgi:hypothetical protein